MNSKEIIEKYLTVKNNNVTQLRQSKVEAENTKPLEQVASNSIISWGIIGFVICWMAIFFMLSKRVRLASKEIHVNITTLHQIPCKNCKFYANEPHLKCAVNPSDVLTEKAVDCSDYCSK